MPWQLHAISALAGTAYLVMMASALLVRYSYLWSSGKSCARSQLRPVTRMRSHTETVNAGKCHHGGYDEPSCWACWWLDRNLYALENLHGKAAVNPPCLYVPPPAHGGYARC